MRKLPPLDVHSHISTDIDADELERLGAVVFIATKSPTDFAKVANRQDLVSIWGIGCHPGLVRVQNAFDIENFKHSIASTPYIAEVGLDGDSRVPLKKQTETLRSIFKVVEQNPRIMSLHSYKATNELLEILSSLEKHKGLILHWWLGDDNDTKRALDLGCYFSINFSMARSTESWKSIPLDRLLIETDHPFGDRFSSAPRQPGRIKTTEAIVAKQHGISPYELRLQTWNNLARIIKETGTYSLLPKPVQAMIDESK